MAREMTVNVDDPKQVAELISSFVNRGDAFSATDAAEILANDHRTLQQGTMNFVIAFIGHMASNDLHGLTDLRNESACRLASKLAAVINEELRGASRLPTI